MSKNLKSIFTTILVISQICALGVGADTKAQDDHAVIPASPLQGPTDPQISNNLDQAEAQVPAIASAFSDWENEREKETPLLLEMRAQLFELFQARIAEVGEENIEKLIEKGKIEVNRPIGRMKITTVDNQRITAFFSATESRAVVIWRKGQIDYDKQEPAKTSLQLKQLLAGYRRGKGLDQVDFMILDQEDSKVVDRQQNPKEKGFFRKEAWKQFFPDQFYAIWRTPTPDNVAFGFALGFIPQYGITMTLSLIKAHGIPALGIPAAHLDPWTPVIVGLYGWGLGIFSDTWNKFAYQGTRSEQIAKQLPNSIAFNLVMQKRQGIGGPIFSVNFISTSVTTLFIARRFISQQWNDVSNLRRDFNFNAGSIRFRVLGHEFKWSRETTERNLIYQMSFLVKQMDYFFQKWERLPFVDSWIRSFPTIPAIPHLPDLNGPLHGALTSSWPYFQMFGAFAVSLFYLYYLRELAKKPVGVDWTARNSEDAQRLAITETNEWSRWWPPQKWPKTIQSAASDKIENTKTKMRNIKDFCRQAWEALKREK